MSRRARATPPWPRFRATWRTFRSPTRPTRPSFLQINGRPVVFVYTDGLDACPMATRWHDANTFGFYIVLKVFSGYRTCPAQPDSWHQYSPAVATDSQPGYSYS